jgi:hypothetical protein
MSNDLTTTRGNLPATNEDFFSMLEADAPNIKGGEGGKAFMKFSGIDGKFSYGAENEPLEPGTQLIMNWKSYRRGWVIWVGGKVEHEAMTFFHEGPQPSKQSLPDLGPYTKDDGPVEQFTIEFATVEEPFVTMVFQANNKSKVRALGALMKDFIANYKMHRDMFPVVEIDEHEFPTKTETGRKATMHAPDFKIVNWITEEQMAELSDGAPSDYEQASADDDTAEELVDRKEVKQAVAEERKAVAEDRSTAKVQTKANGAGTEQRKPRARF